MWGAIQPLVLGLLAVIVLGAAPAARAQEEDTIDAALEMGLDALSRRGCEKYAQILRLDDDQKDAANTLFDGYKEGVEAMTKELGAAMKDLQEKAAGGDFTVFQKEWPEKMKGFQQRMVSLEDGFFDDLKSLLREDQAERWPRLERYRLREELMQMGMVSGAGVDLTVIADKLKIDSESDAALAEQFERYELDVDKPLVALKAAMTEMQDQALEGMSDFDPANPQAMMEKYEKMMEKLMAPARQVRDTNRRYERLIVPLLPVEQAAKFESEFNLRSFPRVYRKSHATKAIVAAQGFADLTEEQRQSLASIGQAYERDAAPANQKWAAEIERKEDSGGGGFMQMMMDGMGEGDPDDPVAQARKARRELDDQTRDRIVAILTEDQQARLPEKGPTTDNPWEDMQALQEEEGADPEQ